MGLLNKLNEPYEAGGIILGTIEDILNWGRARSDWYLHFGLACCAIEFMAMNASHFDFMRFGTIPRATWEHGYHVLKGVDRIIPVHVYVPGCPPRPEAFQDGMIKLQKMIKEEAIFRKRKKLEEESKIELSA